MFTIQGRRISLKRGLDSERIMGVLCGKQLGLIEVVPPRSC